MDTRHIGLLTRGPMWAVTAQGFAALMAEIKARTFFQASAFSSLKPHALGQSQGNKIVVIPVQGVLTKDCSWCGTTYPAIADAVEEAAADPKVKRIVLAVDSPGGEVTGLPETAAVLASAAKTKRISAIVQGTAASAAYWLASQATDITVSPSAEVGSVGVRTMHEDISGMLQQAGIKITEMYSGKHKTEFSPFAPLSDKSKEYMQGRLDSLHAQFLGEVGKGRGARAKTQIRANRFGEGRMFAADQAVAHGLADAVQSPREFYRAIVASEETRTLTDYGVKRARLEVERNRF